MIALGRQAICESVSGLFAFSFHYPLHRLPYFFSLSQKVCVWDWELSSNLVPVPPPGLKNSVIIIPFPPSFSTEPSPIGAIPHPLAKIWVKDIERRV